MKRKKCLVTVALFLFALATVQLPLLAQDNTGSIRGMVYRDINNNGTCATEGEPSVAGIPVELVDDTTRTIVRLQTGADGSYILSEAALGGWQVTVVPGTGWRVTSQQTQAVILTPEVRDVTDIHFCIVEISSPPGGTTLPESGAPIAPGLLMAAALGVALIAAGAGLILHGRTARPD
ncbi:MAG: hypothetical protein JSV68_11000 [Anaerolineaceae bacterium]|nr:MAG: hypothetical protein JSV68_11000 [Anaerolineaceae bacterium]